MNWMSTGCSPLMTVSWVITARATLEILIPDFVKQTSEEKPVEGDELEVGHLGSEWYSI